MESLRQRLDAFGERSLFFLTGYPKSGTTWLHRILDQHPEIACFGEDDFIHLGRILTQAANQYNEHSMERNAGPGFGRHCRFAQEDLTPLLEAAVVLMLTNTGRAPGVKAVGSKFNTLFAMPDYFARMFPGASVVHVVRDVRDVIVSTYFNNLRKDAERARTGGVDLARLVQDMVPDWSRALRSLRSLRKTLGGRYFELRYEDLVAAPERILAETFSFLGVGSGIETVTACLAANTFEKLSGGRQPGEEDRTSFFRRGIAGDWRNHFDAACEAAFRDAGGPAALDEAGFSLNS